MKDYCRVSRLKLRAYNVSRLAADAVSGGMRVIGNARILLRSTCA